jgi:hypothetical protein
MTPWMQAAKSGIASGAAASSLSTAVLAARSRQEAGSAYAGTNATSQVLWGKEALRANAPSVKHTVAGFLIHQGAAMLWATLYERHASGPDGQRSPLRALGVGAAVAALAFVVDYTVTPPRFRPGYEKRVSARSLAMVYVALAVGLAMRDVLATAGSGASPSPSPRFSAPARVRSARAEPA